LDNPESFKAKFWRATSTFAMDHDRDASGSSRLSYFLSAPVQNFSAPEHTEDDSCHNGSHIQVQQQNWSEELPDISNSRLSYFPSAPMEAVVEDSISNESFFSLLQGHPQDSTRVLPEFQNSSRVLPEFQNSSSILSDYRDESEGAPAGQSSRYIPEDPVRDAVGKIRFRHMPCGCPTDPD
jgi:hypothetical protein